MAAPETDPGGSGADDCRVLDLVVTEAALSHVGMPFRSTSLPCVRGVATLATVAHSGVRPLSHSAQPRDAEQRPCRWPPSGSPSRQHRAQTAQQGLRVTSIPLDAVKMLLDLAEVLRLDEHLSLWEFCRSHAERVGFESASRLMRDSSSPWVKGRYNQRSLPSPPDRATHHVRPPARPESTDTFSSNPYRGGTKRGTMNAPLWALWP